MSSLASQPQAALAPGVENERWRLLIDLEDRQGIVAAVASFLSRQAASILELDSHSTGTPPRFYMRVEFEVAPGRLDRHAFSSAFEAEVCRELEVGCWELRAVAELPRICLMVSKYEHCLLDLLNRWRQGELPGEVGLVISNHPDLAEEVAHFGVPYCHIPVHKGQKPEAEAEIAAQIAGECDLVVLARYMQILSGDFLDAVGVPVINIHHSFLPAFAGAGPYERAKERGVKLVGATAHYVTEDLDAGPIIEQDVIRVNHRDSAEEMALAGKDVERTVLARAVKWHLEDRVAVHGNSTLVFS